MRMIDIIQKKKQGEALTEEEIRFFVNGITDGSVPDYQAAALLMAICFKDMNKEEAFLLTDAMHHSGATIDLSGVNGPTVDKHSTGGVGDKVSLIVGPIAAALGCKVAKMSGKGLGHTGGTLDKLESIPGFCINLDRALFETQVNAIGLSIISQTEALAPADKKLYALRDVTATVQNTALIASSIMSKKLASGSQNIVLDVKVGSGAFMKTLDDARELASLMVEIGQKAGRNVKAVLSNMDLPLGYHIGNSLEVKEAIEVLNGRGPEDLKELCFTIAALMYGSCFQKTMEESRLAVEEVVRSGKALEKLAEMVKWQRGDPNLIYHPDAFPTAAFILPVRAPQDGYLSAMDTEAVGTAATLLGAGREKKNSHIDYAAGIVLHVKPGDKVRKGQSIASLRAETEEKLSPAAEKFLSALTFSDTPPAPQPLIYEIME